MTSSRFRSTKGSFPCILAVFVRLSRGKMTVADREFLSDGEVLAQLVSLFQRADPERHERLYQTLGTYLHGSLPRRDETHAGLGGQTSATVAKFTEDRSLTAKEFIAQKQPKTEIERVA